MVDGDGAELLGESLAVGDIYRAITRCDPDERPTLENEQRRRVGIENSTVAKPGDGQTPDTLAHTWYVVSASTVVKEVATTLLPSPSL